MKKIMMVLFLILLVSIPASADFDARMNVINGPVTGPIFERRAECALMIQARVVKAEDVDVRDHALRDAFAQKIINAQVSLNSIYTLIVNDTNVAALIDAGTLGQITDEILLQAVADGWDDLSGVSRLAE